MHYLHGAEDNIVLPLHVGVVSTIYMYFIFWIWFNKRTHYSKMHGKDDFKISCSSSSSWNSTHLYYGIKLCWVYLLVSHFSQAKKALKKSRGIVPLYFLDFGTRRGWGVSFLRRWNSHLTERFRLHYSPSCSQKNGERPNPSFGVMCWNFAIGKAGE
jgi:hypothetical protein